jgi:hypothetical protein
MDLAGSVGRRSSRWGIPSVAFRGTHGDGRLTSYGYATNEDRP